jgi:hypothetical protein
MFAPLPGSNETPHDRFKGFAKAILAVPKSEITPAEKVLSKLESQKTGDRTPKALKCAWN